MKNILFLCCYLILSYSATGQTHTGPEQDCINALPLCSNHFTQPFTYRGKGADQHEVPSSSCLIGENNSVWYTFAIDSPGNLNFLLTPLASGDDYDFALYNTTNNGCAGIYSGLSPELRCSFAITAGVATGLGTNGTVTTAGASGPAILKSLPVYAGQQFALLVDNFNGNSSQGYTLDFSASTCTLGSAINYSLIPLHDTTIYKNQHQFTLKLGIAIPCNGVDTSGTGFAIDSPRWHISSVYPTLPCSGYTRSLTFTFDSINVSDTSFNLIVQRNSIMGLCGDQNSVSDIVHLRVINAPLVPGFSHHEHGDTILVNNSSQGADSVYYYIDSFSNTYPGPNANIGVGAGTYVLCQVATNFVQYDTLCTTIVVTGINDIDASYSITISPNPTTGKIQIELSKAASQTTIQVYNVLGVKIMDQQFATGETKVEMDLSRLPSGTYILHVGQGDERYERRIVKF